MARQVGHWNFARALVLLAKHDYRMDDVSGREHPDVAVSYSGSGSMGGSSSSGSGSGKTRKNGGGKADTPFQLRCSTTATAGSTRGQVLLQEELHLSDSPAGQS
jgi:hypothetical protein